MYFFSQTHKRTHDEAFEEDDDDDWIFDPALDEVMTQFGGGGATTSRDPLFNFQLRPVGARRNWRNVLNKQWFEATLQQHRDITPDDNLGEELTHALRRSIERQITSNPSLTPHSTVHFAMQSSTFTHAFQSTTFTVREFEEGSERLDTYLQALAAKLNSNEDFTPDDTFTVDTTFVLTPGPGRGNGKRYKPSAAAVRGIAKRSRTAIKNKDNLCCARALVTMKALADANGYTRDRDYRNLVAGYPVQERKAQDLHRLAGVPEGPCGLPELAQFQTALPGYQIKVLSIDPPHMMIYAGPTPSDKILRLIKDGDHYDGCSSFKGFLGQSYFCDDCNRGYSTEDFHHHPCDGKWCTACKRQDCPDFIEAKRPLARGKFPTPTSRCPLCHLPHQVHLRHLQKVPRLLPCLRTRCQGNTQKSSRSRSQVRLGGMQHLRTRSPPRLAPMLHSTSARRRRRSQAETLVEG